MRRLCTAAHAAYSFTAIVGGSFLGGKPLHIQVYTQIFSIENGVGHERLSTDVCKVQY